MSAQAFESVEAFYADDERRRRSPELDYGVWWRHRGIVYRVTWVEATGELIAVQLSAPRTQALVDPDKAWPVGIAVIGGTAGSVYLLARLDVPRDELEQRLDGWADVCGGDGSLGWLLDRIGPAPANRSARPAENPPQNA